MGLIIDIVIDKF